MDNRKNLMKGCSAVECLPDTYVDVAVWHVFNCVARLHQQKVKKKPSRTFGEADGQQICFIMLS